MTPLERPRLAYYADDFTGATDAMERLELAGVGTVLFVEAPSENQLAKTGWPEAIGVAGCTRSLPSEQIDKTLRPAFQALRDLGPQHVHYKVCSTFDSSVEIGSIGRVIDTAAEVFPGAFAPVVVGSPVLGRWVAFGNLFAGVGIGAESEAFRLDRHPAMMNHPVTPSGESDLRFVLQSQTDKRIALIDWRLLDEGADAVVQRLEWFAKHHGVEVVVFDTLYHQHLATIGEVLQSYAESGKPLFSVGSSAIESALTAAWKTEAPTMKPVKPESIGPSLILVGSCSPVTAQQVKLAREAGVPELILDPSNLPFETAATDAAEYLTRGESVIVSTGQTTDAGRGEQVLAPALGEAFAKIAERCREPLGERAILIAGGDTSSYTVRALGAESLTMEAPFIPGAPLCRVRAPGYPADGLRIVLKGGQVGKEDLFARFTGKSLETRA